MVPLLLAACGSPAPAPVNTAAAETGYIAKVRALRPGQRDMVLWRAITKGGGAACQGVQKAEPFPDTPDHRAVWRVTCLEGSQWLAALADDGVATITGVRS